MVTLLPDMTKDPASKRQETYSSNLEHFKKVVAQTVKLPLIEPESFIILNAALSDLNLSVCLVFTIYFLQ